jgi:hypothetical protein
VIPELLMKSSCPVRAETRQSPQGRAGLVRTRIRREEWEMRYVYIKWQSGRISGAGNRWGKFQNRDMQRDLDCSVGRRREGKQMKGTDTHVMHVAHSLPYRKLSKK